MNTIGIYRKVIGNVKRFTCKGTVQKKALVSKPDVVDISKELKPSNTDNFDAIINNAKTHLNKNIVKDLEKCSLEEFFEKSKQLIIDSYKIPKELAAQIQPLPSINPNVGMAYDFVQNIIFVNPAVLKRSRSQLFSYLKHEYTHQIQNYQILCTAGLGRSAIKEYARILAKVGADGFIQKYAHISDKEFEALKPQLGFAANWVSELREAMKKGTKAVDEFRIKITENDYNVYYQNLNNLRQMLIKEYGIIPAGTEKAKISEEYFNGFINNLKNPTALRVYLKSRHEKEACGAQTTALFEYLIHRFI